jgi:hypothetical protein
MHIPLGEGDNNAGGSEQLVDLKAQGARDYPPPHHAYHFNPKIDINNQGIIAKIIEEHKRLWIFENLVTGPRSLKKQLLDLIHRRAVGDSYGHLRPNSLVLSPRVP